MSMLAERKRKQKWSLNPRGKAWSEDSNKFGQKMLEKMGWQHGKGLGANENGIKEHIKISYKNDSKGMGYKENDDQWTEHEANFTSLLASLSGSIEKPTEITLNSLEQKSQTSKVRVHYHKFTRGKDLSRYSSKDLANIFGKKSFEEDQKSNQMEKDSSNDESAEECNEVSKGNNLLNMGSMKDYFKKKLPNFGKNNGYVIGNNGVLKNDESESDSENKPRFGFGFTSEIKKETTFVSYIQEDSSTSKRKVEEPIDNNVLSPKKKRKLESTENKGVTNPAFNPMSTPVKVNKHILNTIEENSFEESNCSISMDDNLENLSQNSTSERSIKRNKQSLEEVGIENNSVNENCKNNKKRKKKKEKFDGGLNNPVFNYNVGIEGNSDWCEKIENTFVEDISNPYEVKLKKKTKNKGSSKKNDSVETEAPNSGETTPAKKKKKNKEVVGISNPIFDKEIKNEAMPIEVEHSHNENFDGTENVIQEKHPYEVTRKTKKKKHSTKESIDTEETQNEESLNPYEVVRKKKKTKRDQSVADCLSNSQEVYSGSGLEHLESGSQEENIFELKRKKKVKKNKTGVENYGQSQEITEKGNSGLGYQENGFKGKNPFEVSKKKKIEKNNSECLDSSQETVVQSTSMGVQNNDIIIDSCDLMLNITDEVPVNNVVVHKNNNSEQKVQNKKRKSVRFSNVTQEHIIPNNDEYNNDDNYKGGIDNINFDRIRTHVDEDLDSFTKNLDNCQAEVENDINEQKLISVEDIMIGQVGDPQGENESLPDGTKLKFKHANFDARTPLYHLNKLGAKKSYKHLIKGDIVLKFKNTNLHEISGYADAKKKRNVC